MTEEFISEFVGQAVRRIDESAEKILKCMDELQEADVWHRPNRNSNSVGNIILHLCGNVRQYAISSLGRLQDVREREKEFLASGGHPKTELAHKLVSTISEAKSIIQNISPGELLRKRQVQGYTHSGIGIIIHVTEHLSYHTGQIVFWTKLLKDKDLGFYSGIDLNIKNET